VFFWTTRRSVVDSSNHQPLVTKHRGAVRPSGRQAQPPSAELLETRLALSTFTLNTTLDTVPVNLKTGQDARCEPA
jgi:hypothetical protein